MARSGVTREQVFETADALVREGQNPTVVAVRSRLGGGSPNTITPLLAEWKALHEHQQAASLPAIPEPVEAVLRQVWGVAWQAAQGQLAGEREALAQARKAIEQERAEMLAEIGKLDGELERTRESVQQGRAALEAERQAHEQTRSAARESQARAAERAERIASQDTALEDLRRQIESALQQSSRLETELAHARQDGDSLREAQAKAHSAHEQTRTALHEAQAVIAERTARSVAQDDEIKALHHQLENYASQEQGLKSERDQARREREAQGRELERTAQRLAETEEALRAQHIEHATLIERVRQTDEIGGLIEALKGLKVKAG
ncbi:DNA-binding protein [Thiocystis violacea]|uniref:DNA-binding protein n=1 Tax=Thiocystis violacea TaxID=13725 RepID=UPI001903DA82|nr:DNA-binding protein [Thiocystis violacea]